MILRLLLLAAGLAALAGSLAINRPDSFAVTTPGALLIFVVAAGAIASDAVPLRRVPLACSIATLVLGLALLGRGETQIPVAIAIVVLQVVALASGGPALRPARGAAGPTR